MPRRGRGPEGDQDGTKQGRGDVASYDESVFRGRGPTVFAVEDMAEALEGREPPIVVLMRPEAELMSLAEALSARAVRFADESALLGSEVAAGTVVLVASTDRDLLALASKALPPLEDAMRAGGMLALALPGRMGVSRALEALLVELRAASIRPDPDTGRAVNFVVVRRLPEEDAFGARLGVAARNLGVAYELAGQRRAHDRLERLVTEDRAVIDRLLASVAGISEGLRRAADVLDGLSRVPSVRGGRLAMRAYGEAPVIDGRHVRSTLNASRWTKSAPYGAYLSTPQDAAEGFHEEEKLLIRRRAVRALSKEGEAGLRAFCDELGEGRRPFARAAIRAYASGAAARAGRHDLKLQLLHEAADIHPSVTNQVALASALTEAGALGEARTVMDALENDADAHGDERVAQAAAVLAKQSASQETDAFVTSLVGAPGPSRWEPASRRVFYVLHNSLPYTSAGYSTRSHGIAKAVRAAGYDVQPLTRPGFPFDVKPEYDAASLPEADEIDGLRYRRLLAFGRKDERGRYKLENEYVQRCADLYEALFAAEPPRVVHAASNYVTGLPALIAARRLDIPFLYEARGFWELTRASRDPSFYGTERYDVMARSETVCAQRADMVITLTEAMRELLTQRGVPNDRIVVAHNGVDTDAFRPQPPDEGLRAELGMPRGVPVIGYVGSHVGYEGLDLLMRACATLKARGRDFRLLLVGDGDATEELLALSEQLGLGDKLVAPGRVPHEAVAHYYSLVDVAPFPRRAWPVCEIVSPLKPYEAMAMEKAIVVSSVRALTEIVDHERTGLVFEKEDGASLADALDRLITSSDLRRRLGQAGRAWVMRERTWDAAAGVIADAYERAVGARS